MGKNLFGGVMVGNHLLIAGIKLDQNSVALTSLAEDKEPANIKQRVTITEAATPPRTVTKPINLPMMGMAEAKSSLRLTEASSIPFPLSNAGLAIESKRTTAGRLEGVFSAISGGEIDKSLAKAEQSGHLLSGIMPAYAAAQKAMKLSSKSFANGQLNLLIISADYCYILHMIAGEYRFGRLLPMPSEGITGLTTEVARSAEYIKSILKSDKVEQLLIITDAEINIDGLEQQLKQTAGIIASRYNPLEDFIFNQCKADASNHASILLAVGAAMAGSKRLNLLPKDKRQGGLATIKRYAYHLAAGLLLLCFSFIYNMAENRLEAKIEKSRIAESSFAKAGSFFSSAGSDKVSLLKNQLAGKPTLHGTEKDWPLLFNNIASSIPVQLALSSIEIIYPDVETRGKKQLLLTGMGRGKLQVNAAKQFIKKLNQHGRTDSWKMKDISMNNGNMVFIIASSSGT